MGSEDAAKVQSSSRRRLQKLGLLICTSFIVFVFTSSNFILNDSTGTLFFFRNRNDVRPRTVVGNGIKVPSTEQCDFIIGGFQHPQMKSKKWPTKPIWLNMYQDTISDEFHKNLINPLTNTPNGGKNYYISIKGRLRHCQGDSQTVTCANIHPTVEMRPGSLNDKYDNPFFTQYITVIRNPMTAFPATHTSKAQKYHGVVGQAPEEDWKSARDEWFTSMWTGWKAIFLSWNETKYEPGMYLVYEDLMNEETGPNTIRALANFLQTAGFDIPALHRDSDESTSFDERMACFWNHLEPTTISENEFKDYIPSYTQEQKEFLLKELSIMIDEFQSDVELVGILERYKNDIETKIPLE